MTFDPKQLKALQQAAQEAAKSSYSPYSNFPTGAAVLTLSGEIFNGTNIENASYGLTVCAERMAIFKAVSSGKKKLVALAANCIKGDTDKPATLMPCGACRQVMIEFMDKDSTIFVKGIGTFTLNDLLPKAFNL